MSDLVESPDCKFTHAVAQEICSAAKVQSVKIHVKSHLGCLNKSL